jgi:cytochrome c biogenesis protein CcmG/thiol:disulfide interchange protein DsbE
MQSPGSALSAVLLCLLLVGCSRTSTLTSVRAANAADEPSANDSPIHKPAPDFALKDRDGATVHLSDYKGKVVMLDFWATWCGPCKIEIPWFMEFEQQYKDKGFAVLGVSMDEGGWDDVKPYIEERKINYRILLGDDKVDHEYGGIDSLPTTFLIDRSGKIAAVHVGIEKGKNELRDEIDQLLAAKDVTNARAGDPAVVAGAK